MVLYYPLALDLKGRRVVVVGGGRVAERKIRKLLEAEAKIKVVSPEISPSLMRLASRDKIIWVSRFVRSRDLRSAALVIAATSDAAINRSVSRWARKEGAWVNVVDNPALSDFISLAILRRPKALIGVYSNGRDPVLSRDLKNFLEENWDDFLSYRDRL